MTRLFRLVIADAGILLVDAALTLALIAWTPAGPYTARAIAMIVAMALSWRVYRNPAFGRSRDPQAVGSFRYGVVGVTSALVNYGVYAALLYRAPMLQPLAALLLASLAGMAYRFFGYSRFVFRQ